MKNEIYMEVDYPLTLKEYLSIASQMMQLITEAARGVNEIDANFSVTEISNLLNKICVPMAGEFEIRHTPSCYIQIVYTPDVLKQTVLDEGYIIDEFVDTHDRRQNCLWINEKVISSFINRKLHGVAFMIYFYLGYLMTQDAAFGISHNISFEKILEYCDQFSEDIRVKHPTTLMCALADLEDAGLVKWNVKTRTFELLYITPYDPNEKV